MKKGQSHLRITLIRSKAIWLNVTYKSCDKFKPIRVYYLREPRYIVVTLLLMKCLNEIVVIIGREISKILKGRTLSKHFNFLFVQQIIKLIYTWSSGCGWWLMFERLWVRIPAPYTGWRFGHFSHWFVVNIVCCLFEKTKNKRRRGRGWPILKNKTYLSVR